MTVPLAVEVDGTLREARGVKVSRAEVAGVRRVIPQDHPWINTARQLGICLGDELRRST